MVLLSRVLHNALVIKIMEIFRSDRVAFPLVPHSKGTCAKGRIDAEKMKNGERLQVHYLSNEFQNESIAECSDLVKQHVLGEMKSAKYYAIIVDSKPNLSHVEQTTFILC